MVVRTRPQISRQELRNIESASSRIRRPTPLRDGPTPPGRTVDQDGAKTCWRRRTETGFHRGIGHSTGLDKPTESRTPPPPAPEYSITLPVHRRRAAQESPGDRRGGGGGLTGGEIRPGCRGRLPAASRAGGRPGRSQQPSRWVTCFPRRRSANLLRPLQAAVPLRGCGSGESRARHRRGRPYFRPVRRRRRGRLKSSSRRNMRAQAGEVLPTAHGRAGPSTAPPGEGLALLRRRAVQFCTEAVLPVRRLPGRAGCAGRACRGFRRTAGCRTWTPDSVETTTS